MKRLRPDFSLVLGFALVAVLVSAPAQSAVAATTLDFNDLGPSTLGVHMPTNYCGFNWYNSNWHYMSLTADATNNFLALSGTGTAAVSVGGGKFYFDGADFWSRRGADANGLFYFILYSNGVVVYDGRNDPDGKQRFTGVHQHFTANYTGLVDGMAVVFTQGGGDWDHLAMDNFQFHGWQSAQPPTQFKLSRHAAGFALQFAGTPGQPYAIQACADLGGGEWGQLTVTAADASGAVVFVDGQTNLPQRFYRAMAP